MHGPSRHVSFSGSPQERAIQSRSGGETRLVQCMWSWVASADFDLIAVPEHDGAPTSVEFMSTVGAVHKATAARLADAAPEWSPRLANLAPPLIAVLVGPATRRRSVAEAGVDTFASRMWNMTGERGASVMSMHPAKTAGCPGLSLAAGNAGVEVRSGLSA